MTRSMLSPHNLHLDELDALARSPQISHLMNALPGRWNIARRNLAMWLT
jgi:hypothetical protein